jgi:hypothetical protein
MNCFAQLPHNCLCEQASDIWVRFEGNLYCYRLMIEKYGMTSKSKKLDEGIFVEAQGVYNLLFIAQLICDNSSEFHLDNHLNYSRGYTAACFKTYKNMHSK